MKHVIIGTAGHVDHGKTTLIQALTGTNTDRLQEEQERGMTIDIGFAALKLPDGTIAGIVDVPGHERFLKNMLAGATGVDVVLLVIAADESVMPQTIEHLDILKILHVRNGVIALTKSDLVDKEWADAVEEDIRAQLEGSFLSDAPIIRVSTVTNKGIEALKKALMAAVSRAEAKNASLPVRLPVDRVFTRPGFGTVVTGTLTGGLLRVNDTIEILPQNMTARVRGLQVHGQKVTEAEAGSRVAVNLASIDTIDLERGAALVTPGSAHATDVFDGILHLLPNIPRPLKDRARIRIHVGTAEIIGRVRMLDGRAQADAGDRLYIQFRGERPFVCLRGDRFVVRSYSPLRTIGGGTILDPAPARHKIADPVTIASLSAKERGTPEDVLETILQRHPDGIPRKDLLNASGLSVAETEGALNNLEQQQRCVRLPQDRLISATALRALLDRGLTALSAYHERFPLRPGMPKEEFRTALGRNMDARAFTALSNHWINENKNKNRIVAEGPAIRLADFQVSLTERQQSLLSRIEEFYLSRGIAMPTIPEVVEAVQAPPDAVNALMRVGVERGRFHRLAEDQYYHADTIAEFKRLVADYVQSHGPITVGAFRDLAHSNRRFSLMILEYLDLIRFTRRQGDDRVLYSTA